MGPRVFFLPPLPFFGFAFQGIPDIPDISVFGRGNSPTNILFWNQQVSFPTNILFFQPPKIFVFPNDDFFSFFSRIGPRVFFPRLCRFSVSHYREFQTFRTCPFLPGETLQPKFCFSTDNFSFQPTICFFNQPNFFFPNDNFFSFFFPYRP